MPSPQCCQLYQDFNESLLIASSSLFLLPFYFLWCWTWKAGRIVHQPGTFHQCCAESFPSSEAIHRVFCTHHQKGRKENPTTGDDEHPSLQRSRCYEVHQRVRQRTITQWDWPCSRRYISTYLNYGSEMMHESHNQAVDIEGSSGSSWMNNWRTPFAKPVAQSKCTLDCFGVSTQRPAAMWEILPESLHPCVWPHQLHYHQPGSLGQVSKGWTIAVGPHKGTDSESSGDCWTWPKLHWTKKSRSNLRPLMHSPCYIWKEDVLQQESPLTQSQL